MKWSSYMVICLPYNNNNMNNAWTHLVKKENSSDFRLICSFFNPYVMFRVNLTHFNFCVDQSAGYPYFFSTKFSDFSSSRVMNCCVKSGHFDVSWSVCTQFVYKDDVAGHFDPDTKWLFKSQINMSLWCTLLWLPLKSQSEPGVYGRETFSPLSFSLFQCPFSEKYTKNELQTIFSWRSIIAAYELG